MRKKVTSHQSQVTSAIRTLKFCVLSLGLTFFALSFTLACYAKDITILYTGETHAMLYPCNCPKEPDGGIARRATLIKELRKKNPDALLLDSGGFFAGGAMDEYSQNTELDKQRTLLNLKAMQLMGYDAVTVGDDELNFGRQFFEENAAGSKFKFLSSNLKSDKVLPYLIKEVAGVKIGIIGVTTMAVKHKADDLAVTEPDSAVARSVAQLKKESVDVILLLSHLGEAQDLEIIKDVPGIDILIVGHSRQQEAPSGRVNSTLILRPSWQGRRLGKLTIQVQDKRITGLKEEEIRLSDKVSDDPQIKPFLPACFSDANCKKSGYAGVCRDPGVSNARCIFSVANKVELLMVVPKVCHVCTTEKVVNYLKQAFPGLNPAYLYYPDEKTVKMVNDYEIKTLPAYFLGKEADKEKGFESLKDNLQVKGDRYILKPSFSGFSYLLGRERKKPKLDLFLSLYEKDTQLLLEAIRDFNPTLHFLALERDNNFETAKGPLETEDYLRAVCINKHYPQIFWDYLICRAKNTGTSWWEDCLSSDADIAKIRVCATGEEGRGLLRENISLSKELEIMFGPTYLLNNQEIFGSKGIPTKDELKKILESK